MGENGVVGPGGPSGGSTLAVAVRADRYLAEARGVFSPITNLEVVMWSGICLIFLFLTKEY